MWPSLWKSVTVQQKVIQSLHAPVILLLRIYLKEMKICVNTKIYTLVFRTMEMWEQPKCPPINEWINTM
jgi:hypothetical protein